MGTDRIELNRKELKREAKESISRRRPSTYLVALVYVLILLVLQFLSLRIRYPGLGVQELAALYAGRADPETLLALLYYSPGTIGMLLFYAIEIMSLIVGVGFISFCLLASRREEAGFGSLFDGFGIFFRALWLSVLRALLLMLWALPAMIGMVIAAVYVEGETLLQGMGPILVEGLGDTALILFAAALMIAGIVLEIIAAYRYSMCFFILLDAPDKGAFQCLRESRDMTRGYKGKLFVLDLSFLGWMLLSAIPFVILYTLPYMQVTQANYYRALSGRGEAPRSIDVSV